MNLSALCRLLSAAALSCATAACQTTTANNGSGYQFVRFTDPKAAVAASQDPTAGPSIASNNDRCRRDPDCRK